MFLKVKSEINRLIDSAISVCLISDIWTNKQMLDFMGVAASIIDQNHKRRIVVLGLKLMPGKHNAENIKTAIEDIVNEYSFDKNNIIGHSCDEGSAYVRLMKQLVIEDIVEDSVEYDDDDDNDFCQSASNYDQYIHQNIEDNSSDHYDFETDLLSPEEYAAEYEKDMRNYVEIAEKIVFENPIRSVDRTDVEVGFDFTLNSLEDDMYDFERPLINDKDQPIISVGSPAYRSDCLPVKKLEIEISNTINLYLNNKKLLSYHFRRKFC